MKMNLQWHSRGEFVQVALAQLLHSLKSQTPSGFLDGAHSLRQYFVPQRVAQMTCALNDLWSVNRVLHSTKFGEPV